MQTKIWFLPTNELTFLITRVQITQHQVV
jgi:hypothetical protein